jgi:tetratricopeptide (TPR) repeat protein
MTKRIIPLWRRYALACVAVALGALLFHGHIADALITRGDDRLLAGDTRGAERFYQRALVIDRGSIVAADRLAFALVMQHTKKDERSAIAIATAALSLHESDVLLADRALAEQLLRRWADAARDFARAGAIAKDARYESFAGRLSLKAGNADAARKHFVLALRDDPGFAPARAALERMRR